MKNKRIIFVVTIVLCVCAVAFALYFANSRPTMTGQYLVSTTGVHIIVDKNGMPNVMSNQTNNEGIFEGLQSGDYIKVTYDGIDLSYPGQMGIYNCKLIKKGDISNIPEKTFSELQGMGWQFQ